MIVEGLLIALAVICVIVALVRRRDDPPQVAHMESGSSHTREP